MARPGATAVKHVDLHALLRFGRMAREHGNAQRSWNGRQTGRLQCRHLVLLSFGQDHDGKQRVYSGGGQFDLLRPNPELLILLTSAFFGVQRCIALERVSHIGSFRQARLFKRLEDAGSKGIGQGGRGHLVHAGIIADRPQKRAVGLPPEFGPDRGEIVSTFAPSDAFKYQLRDRRGKREHGEQRFAGHLPHGAVQFAFRNQRHQRRPAFAQRLAPRNYDRGSGGAGRTAQAAGCLRPTEAAEGRDAILCHRHTGFARQLLLEAGRVGGGSC